MIDIIKWFGGLFVGIISVLDYATFDVGGYTVSVFDLMIAVILFTMVLSVFWKGARG